MPFFDFQPRLYQARVQVDDVGHNGCPQHADRRVDAAAIQPRHRGMVSDLPPVGMNQEDLHQVAEPDHQNKHHDADFERAKTAQLESQDGEDAHGGDNGRDKHHRGAGQPEVEKVAAEKEVKAERGAKKLGQVGSQS